MKNTIGMADTNTVLRSLPESELMKPEGYAPEFLRALLRSGSLAPLFSPEGSARDRLEIIRESAFVSVELALSLGITVSLFTAPVERFAPDLWRTELKEGFLTGGMLGGMMITEPGCGTDIMACTTRARAIQGGWELAGTKHWAGLSGLADYWLVLARAPEGERTHRLPSLNFYICRADPLSFRLVKRYGSAGLRSIPYGLTEIHAREGVLGPLLTGSRIHRFRKILGILQRSRISIAAITYGACDRIDAEATRHAEERIVFGKSLNTYGQVQARLAEIKAARDVLAVLHALSCNEAETADRGDRDVDPLTSNAIKIVSTDLAFAAATSASQLLGGESYRTDTYIGRATADLRPFRIFEGSNDVLCEAIWLAVEKSARMGGESFTHRVRDAFQAAGLEPPRLQPFEACRSENERTQGLRCLGGRILANALCLRWCLDGGLSPKTCRPLVARMARDVSAANTWGSDAGLIEY